MESAECCGTLLLHRLGIERMGRIREHGDPGRGREY